MTEATTPPVPPTPVPAQGRSIPVRTYLLAGASIGGTLCASLASTSSINLPFAIASAIFGGAVVLLTAAPAASAPAPVPAPAAVPAAAPAPSFASDLRGDSVWLGISAAVVTYIILQIELFALGWVLGGVFAEGATPGASLASDITDFIAMVRVPVDLLLGAYVVARARNVFIALGAFLLAYVGCYCIEWVLATIFNGAMYNVLFAIVPSFVTVAIGALGARFLSRLKISFS